MIYRRQEKKYSSPFMRQAVAVLFSFILILGMMSQPYGAYVYASENETVSVENATDTSLPVHVIFTKDAEKRIAAGSWSEGNPAEDIEQYNVSLVNNTDAIISDWTIVITTTDASSYNSGWCGVSRDGNTITIVPTTVEADGWSNSNVVPGTPATGAGFQIFGSAIDGASVKVTYKKGSSEEGSNSGGKTYDGNNIGHIDSSKKYNFAKLLQLSLYFYDANMCGDDVEDKSLYSSSKYDGWRGNCHVKDYFEYNGVKYPATGGYHDAGDHVKFGLPMAESFVTLVLAYKEFGDAFDELNQTDHFKTIVDHYCEYVRRCTVLNDSGNEALAFCYQVGSGRKDHNSWCAPEVEDENATMRSYSLVATKDNPATEYVALPAAALAINYINFHNEDDLTYAKALFAMAMNNSKANGEVDTTGQSNNEDYYNPTKNGDSYEDEYCLCAAILYKITGDSVYKQQYDSY